MAELKKDGIRAAMSEGVERETLKGMGQRATNPQETLEPKLERCPFCGGLAIKGTFNVWCDNCRAQTARDVDATEAEVIEQWNTRVRDSAAATVDNWLKEIELACNAALMDVYDLSIANAPIPAKDCRAIADCIGHRVGQIRESVAAIGAAASFVALRDEAHDHTWEGSNNGSGVSYLCADPDCRIGIDDVTE